MLYYRVILFTTTSDLGEEIDIDHISEYFPQDETEEKFKNLIIDFGIVDNVGKAFELNINHIVEKSKMEWQKES